MVEIHKWMEQATEALRQAFGPQLLYVGLQGSYRRGEATDQSDIDILAVLEMLDIQDLRVYRQTLRALPHGDIACGFVCSRQQLACWPRYELFQLVQETDDYYGRLAEWAPPWQRADIVQSVHIGAANLYHATAHSYVSGDEGTWAPGLVSLYKGAFFVLQVAQYLRGGKYMRTKAELLVKLRGEEAEILRLSMDKKRLAVRMQEDCAEMYQQMLAWSGELMCEEFAPF